MKIFVALAALAAPSLAAAQAAGMSDRTHVSIKIESRPSVAVSMAQAAFREGGLSISREGDSLTVLSEPHRENVMSLGMWVVYRVQVVPADSAAVAYVSVVTYERDADRGRPSARDVVASGKPLDRRSLFGWRRLWARVPELAAAIEQKARAGGPAFAEVWRHSFDPSRSFAADSSGCALTAAQLARIGAPSSTGNAFERCMRDERAWERVASGRALPTCESVTLHALGPVAAGSDSAAVASVLAAASERASLVFRLREPDLDEADFDRAIEIEFGSGSVELNRYGSWSGYAEIDIAALTTSLRTYEVTVPARLVGVRTRGIAVFRPKCAALRVD